MSIKKYKYKKGDCFSIKCEDKKYLGLLITNCYNNYYDLTLLDFQNHLKPTMKEINQSKVFGTRFGSWEDIQYSVDVIMYEVKKFENNNMIEFVGKVKLNDKFGLEAYRYLESTGEIKSYFESDIFLRKTNSDNAEKFPNIAFGGMHLIDLKYFMMGNSETEKR